MESEQRLDKEQSEDQALISDVLSDSVPVFIRVTAVALTDRQTGESHYCRGSCCAEQCDHVQSSPPSVSL